MSSLQTRPNLHHAGMPSPLGPSVAQGPTPGINFAVFSQHATSMILEVYQSDGSAAASFPLQRDGNRTEDVWHVCIEGLPKAGVLLFSFRSLLRVCLWSTRSRVGGGNANLLRVPGL